MDLSRRTFLTAAAGAGLGAALPVFGKSHVLNGPAFGSTWRIVLGGKDDPGVVERVVRSVVDETNRAFSPYDTSSEIGRFNRSLTSDWMPVTPLVKKTVRAALALARETGGAFDPTVGPVVGRFGYGPITGHVADLGSLEVDDEALRKGEVGLTLDLCGIAKGGALDQMVDAIEHAGVADCLVELGGEIRAIGRHASGRPWQVGIERPDPGSVHLQRVIAPGRRALATSGTTHQGYRAVGHLIDPRSERPVDGSLASVSVLAETALRADALATALMVMGDVAGPVFAEASGIDALFLVRRGSALEEIVTGRMAEHFLA